MTLYRNDMIDIRSDPQPAHRLQTALAPELVDIVIDFLCSDRETLNVCSLVCKTWLPAARYHLFGTIILRGGNTGSFHALRASPNFTATPFIHRLIIMDFDNVVLASKEGSSELDGTDDIKECFGNLIFVESLKLDNFLWESESCYRKVAFVACFSTITKLFLSDASFDTFTSVFRTICSFPLLHELFICDVAWSSAPDDHMLSQFTFSPPPLNRLALEICYRRDILDALLTQKSISGVEILQLGLVAPQDTHAVARYLRALGPSLKHLEFGFGGMDSGGDAG